jgi:hypothetical protein
MAGKVYAGFTGLPGGVNSGMDSSLIKDVELARGVNISVRGGLVETRGGFVLEGVLDNRGVFRGAEVWRLDSGDLLVAVLGPDIVVRSFNTGQQWLMTAGFQGSPDWCYLCQVDRWMVIQNGVDRPIVLQYVNGEASLYGRDPTEVSLSIGTIGSYMHKRLHYVPTLVPGLTPAIPADDATEAELTTVPDDTTEDGRMSFVSSDIRDNIYPHYVFRMTEHRYLSEGGAVMPAELGFIEAFGQMRGAATATGYGPLVVFGREGVAAFDVSKARTSWLTDAFGQILFRGAGTVSSRAVVSVNDDLVYIDTCGDVRVLKYDKTDLAGSSGILYNVPRSNEMRYYIKLGNKTYLREVSAATNDNRFAWTLVGTEDKYYKAVGVLDEVTTYSMAAKDPPAYYGIWTGFKFHQVLQARKDYERFMFAVVKSKTGVALLRYSDDAYTDPESTPVLSTVVTKAQYMDTEGTATAMDDKRLQYFELWVDRLKRDTTLSVYYRPTGYSKWSLAGSKTLTVPTGGPDQARSAVKIPITESSIETDPVSNRRLNVGNRFDFMVRWSGYCRIPAFRAIGIPVPQPESDSCDVDNSSASQYPTEVLDVDFDYEVSSL